MSSTLSASLLVVLWLVLVLAPGWSYLQPMYDPPTDPLVTAATELRRTTPPGAHVVYLGEDWNPTTEYYADRPGLMLPTKLLAMPALLERLPHEDYRYVFSFAPDTDALGVLSQWKWVGVVGPRTYVVGSRRSDVANAPVYASTTPTPTHESRADVTTLDCRGKGLAVPASTPITITAAPSDQLRIRLARDLAPLPRVGTIYSTTGTSLSCSGASSIGVSVDSQ